MISEYTLEIDWDSLYNWIWPKLPPLRLQATQKMNLYDQFSYDPDLLKLSQEYQRAILSWRKEDSAFRKPRYDYWPRVVDENYKRARRETGH